MIEFFLPYEVVGKKAPKFAKRGKFVSTYKPKRESENSKAIETLMLPHRPKEPMDGPLSLYLVVCRPGGSMKKVKYKWAPTKPDLDNYMKQVMDCAERMGFVVNDSRVVYVGMAKIAGDIHGAYVKIAPAHEGELAATLEAFTHGRLLV